MVYFVIIILDLLIWWGESQFVALKTVAYSILCISASSSESERVFSTTGRLISERRSQLSPETVNMMIFMNSISKYKDF